MSESVSINVYSACMCALDANVNIYANFKLVSRLYLKERRVMLCINEITYKVKTSWGKSHLILKHFPMVIKSSFSEVFIDFPFSSICSNLNSTLQVEGIIVEPNT